MITNNIPPALAPAHQGNIEFGPIKHKRKIDQSASAETNEVFLMMDAIAKYGLYKFDLISKEFFGGSKKPEKA